MISWKYSFEKVSKELELAKKKKQALDNLFSAGKISQPTYENLNTSLTNAIADIEAQQKELAGKMTEKINQLEEQIGTLEIFLASTEIEYATGEIDEELHQRESNALTIGLESARQQLNVIKEAMIDFFPKEAELVSPPTPAEPMEEAGEETVGIPTEPQIESPVEATEEVEPVSEEVTSEQPMDVEVTEEVETLPETPVEEMQVTEETETLPETLVEEMPTEEESLSETNDEPIEEVITTETAEASEEIESAEASDIEENETAEEEASIEESSTFQSEEGTTTEY